MKGIFQLINCLLICNDVLINLILKQIKSTLDSLLAILPTALEETSIHRQYKYRKRNQKTHMQQYRLSNNYKFRKLLINFII